MPSCLLACALLGNGVAHAQESAAEPDAAQVSPALAQLRHVFGEWDVTTTFFGEDGAAGAAHAGRYRFEWVIEDAVLQGVSDIPDLSLRSAIMFYLRPSANQIEMISVGQDGIPWTMTGDAGSEVRETPNRPMSDGSTLKLRFIRFNVEKDRFESRMERSLDGGKTWQRANHQVFTRVRPRDDAGQPLSWLSGNWIQCFGPNVVEERWIGPSHSVIVGANLTHRPNGVSYEFLRLAPGDGGQLALHVQPSGQAPTEFPLAQAGTMRLVFEKLDHDFPQRVIYWREGEKLRARIEGMVDGSLEGFDWHYARAEVSSCVRQGEN